LIIVLVQLLVKKIYFVDSRWKSLLLGFLLGALISSSTTLMLTTYAKASSFPGGNQGFNGTAPSGQNGMNPMSPATSETATAIPTATATPLPTNTPTPTITPTVKVVENMEVCIEFDYLNKTNIRVFPSDQADVAGSFPSNACFTVDGKNTDYPGWYHFAQGQNGVNGVFLQGAYKDSTDLWVNGVHLTKSDSVLSDLPDVEVTEKK